MQRRILVAGPALVAALVTVVVTGCSAAPSAPHVTHTVTVAPPSPSAAASSTTRSTTRMTPVSVSPAKQTQRRTVHTVVAVNHCARNTSPQKVIVSIAAQHMWFCAAHRTVKDTAITSGMVGPDTSTPTGDYMIQGRNTNTTLTLNTGATYAVHYWIPFDAPLFGFHDSSWQHFPYGSAKYKTQGSHGCVHMPLRAIAFLYRWAVRPTAVHIS